ncbi:MAG: glycosyltransferase [Planctomycetales bacterium]|nr:glycosyltransferase [Planctomycetales bacterium]
MSRRVLCCSGSLEGGGSERQLWMLASGLDVERFEPEVYLLYRRGLYLPQLPPRIPVHAFDTAYKPFPIYLPGKIHRAQVRHLREVICQRRIDLVYDRTYHMTLVTAAACRSTGTPRVSVIVNPPSRDFCRGQERFFGIKRRLLARAYRNPRCCVVTVSQAVADDAAEFYGLRRESIEVIPSGVDTEAIRQAAEREAPEFDFDSSVDLKVVVVGRLSAQKGQHTVLQAMAALRQQRPELRIELQLLGDGPDREALQQLAAALKIDDGVRFLGFQSNPYPAIRSADLLCLPSLYEGLPNVVMEALCLETPVLAADCSGSLRALLGDGQRGVLVPVGDVPRLAAEMWDRVQQPAAWQTRAAAGYQWIVQQHGLQPWLQRMQDLFAHRLAG